MQKCGNAECGNVEMRKCEEITNVRDKQSKSIWPANTAGALETNEDKPMPNAKQVPFLLLIANLTPKKERESLWSVVCGVVWCLECWGLEWNGMEVHAWTSTHHNLSNGARMGKGRRSWWLPRLHEPVAHAERCPGSKHSLDKTKQTNKQTNKQTDKQTNKQTNRQESRQKVRTIWDTQLQKHLAHVRRLATHNTTRDCNLGQHPHPHPSLSRNKIVWTQDVRGELAQIQIQFQGYQCGIAARKIEPNTLLSRCITRPHLFEGICSHWLWRWNRFLPFS